jgi:hypothetical protein
MNVLLVGFYGVMNAGDDLLQQSLAWLFREHRLTFSGVLPAQDVIQQFDLLVVGGGSLWPQHSFFQLADDYARDLRIPYMVLGISAKSYDANTAQRTRLLIERAVLFQVRDAQTAQWLDHPLVHVGPDLFWTAPWCGDSESSNVPEQGVAFAPRSDALATWPLPDLMKALSPLGPIHGWPFFYGDGRNDGTTLSDYQALASAMDGVPESFSLQPLRHSRLSFSMRYHGLQCALRAGRPVLTGNVHAKLGSFCAEHGLESWQVESIKALASAAREMSNNFQRERETTLGLRKKLLAEGSSLATLIRERTSTIPARKMSPSRKFLITGIRNMLSKIS